MVLWGWKGQWGGIGVKLSQNREKKKTSGYNKYFTILIMVMVSWTYPDIKTLQIVHFKSVQFIACPFNSMKLFKIFLWKPMNMSLHCNKHTYITGTVQTFLYRIHCENPTIGWKRTKGKCAYRYTFKPFCS